jgi:glycosyltransferase involved in cell wall biosynthesis
VVQTDALAVCSMKALRIAINAQLRPGSGHGGVEKVVRVLTGLSQLEGPERYLFVALEDQQDWLRSLVRGTSASVVTPRRSIGGGLIGIARRLTGRRTTTASTGRQFDSLGCDVVHFPYQVFHRTAAPSIFNPHDLQHRHYPEFFNASTLQSREALYGPACRSAHTVAVASQFVKNDLIEQFELPPAKIRVIPWALLPIGPSQTEPAPPQSNGELPKPFALYPAMLWEHKNHRRLFDAMALLRDTKGLRVHLVCTGFKTEYWPVLERHVLDRGLTDQVTFTGVVADHELGALYRDAQFVIIPSLFEAASAPMLEAWQHGTPVACAAITSLPEQAGDAALLFDPTSIQSIASALETMTTDGSFRNELRARGIRRLQEFDSVVTLKRYRALYRQAAGLVLNEEDRSLLDGT